MSIKGQVTNGLAPSAASHHEGIVLGLLALIVIIRLAESGRIPAAWSAVFGGAPAAPAAPAASTARPPGYAGSPTGH